MGVDKTPEPRKPISKRVEWHEGGPDLPTAVSESLIPAVGYRASPLYTKCKRQNTKLKIDIMSTVQCTGETKTVQESDLQFGKLL